MFFLTHINDPFISYFLLQFNPLLRDIFGLGAPLIVDSTVKANKISRFEKVTAAFCLWIPTLESFNLKDHRLKPSSFSFHSYSSTNSIFSMQLPSRPGRNRGTKSGTNGLTSCNKRKRTEGIDEELPWFLRRQILNDAFNTSTVGHTKTWQTLNRASALVLSTYNNTVLFSESQHLQT